MSENKWPLIRTFKCYKKKKKVKICWIFKYFLSWLVVALWKDNLASPVLYLPIPHIWRPKTFSQNSGAIAGPARCIPKLLKTAFKNHEALLTVYFLLPNMQLQNLPLSHRVFDLGRNRTRPGIGNRKQAPCQKNKSQIAVRCTPQAKYLKRKPSFWGAELLTIPFFFLFFFHRWKQICSSPSVCTAATKLQVLPLSATSILVPLRELLKQHAGYFLLHVLPAAILFQVTDLPDAEPQGNETTLRLLLSSQHRAIPGTVCSAYLSWPHSSKVCITAVLFRSFTSLFWRWVLPKSANCINKWVKGRQTL